MGIIDDKVINTDVESEVINNKEVDIIIDNQEEVIDKENNNDDLKDTNETKLENNNEEEIVDDLKENENIESEEDNSEEDDNSDISDKKDLSQDIVDLENEIKKLDDLTNEEIVNRYKNELIEKLKDIKEKDKLEIEKDREQLEIEKKEFEEKQLLFNKERFKDKIKNKLKIEGLPEILADTLIVLEDSTKINKQIEVLKKEMDNQLNIKIKNIVEVDPPLDNLIIKNTNSKKNKKKKVNKF